MKLHNTYNRSTQGFTLIEILIVMGIFTMLASMGLAFSFDSYRGYLFRSEYGQITQVIAKARNLAANNFNQAEHGVHFDESTYTLFIGNTYDSSSESNIEFARNSAIDVKNDDQEIMFDIIFEQLSGNLSDCDSDSCKIKFTYGNYIKEVTVSEVGAISW